MSLHRLSAGAGYQYLLRHTACGDVERDPSTPLTAYYTDDGYPPGRWLGTGLAGFGDGTGIAAGTAVSEDAMSAVFGHGRDPVSGARHWATPTRPTAPSLSASRTAAPRCPPTSTSRSGPSCWPGSRRPRLPAGPPVRWPGST